jgi:hypothetical protein
MKVGQIVKVTPQGLKNFTPGIRSRLLGEIGLVVQENYDLSYKLDHSKPPEERVKIYPAVVRFDALKDLDMYDDGVMLFRDQVEVLS